MPHSSRRWRPAVVLPVVTLLALTGCGAIENDGVRGLREVIDTGEELVATFKSVKDPESARNVADKCDRLYDRMVAAQQRIIAHESEHGETRGLKITIEKLQRDLLAMQAELQTEALRVGGLHTLPEEFWTPIRDGSYEIVGLSMRYAQQSGAPIDPELVGRLIDACDLYEDQGAEQIVEMELRGLPVEMREKALARLTERLGRGTRVVSLEDPETGNYLAVVGPSTMDEVAEAVNFAEVDVRDDGQHMFEFQVSLRELDPEQWAPRPGQAPSPYWPLESQQAYTRAIEEHGGARVVKFVLVDESGQKVPDGFVLRSIISSFRARTYRGEVRRHGDSGWAAPVSNFDLLCRSIPFGEVVERDDQAMSITIRVGTPGGRAVSMRRPGRPGAVPPPERRPLAPARGLPDSSDPQYHKKLCDLLVAPSGRLWRDKAIDALLSIDAQEIADAQVRKQVARNFRTLAFEERIERQGKAVQGLIKYAGRYSIPVLCELMDKGGVWVHDEVFKALAAANDARAAESVVGQLGGQFTHDRAVACLRKMGGGAEPALAAAARSDNAEVSLAAIELLGDVGGEASLGVLRQAARARNEEVSAAARNSMRRVRARLRGEEA